MIVWCDGPRWWASPQAPWELAVTKIRAWAWVRNLSVAQIRRRQGGDITFYVARRRPDSRSRYRSICLCGWRSAAPELAAMASARASHRADHPTHFVGEWCGHPEGSLKADNGAVMCLDCGVHIGRDTA